MEQNQSKSMRELKWEEKRNNLNKSRLNNPNANTLTRINPPVQFNTGDDGMMNYGTARPQVLEGLTVNSNNRMAPPSPANVHNRYQNNFDVSSSVDQNALNGESNYSSYHTYLKDDYKNYIKNELK